jgi:hypothetical protein
MVLKSSRIARVKAKRLQPMKVAPVKRHPCGCRDVAAIARASAEIVERR